MNTNPIFFDGSLFAVAFALAAASGAALRHVCNTALKSYLGQAFPWGIFCVNILGCFGFGCVLALTEHTPWLQENVKTILLTAFLGAFTTFSSLIFDADIFLKNKQFIKLSCYIGGQIIFGIAAMSLALRFF